MVRFGIFRGASKVIFLHRTEFVGKRDAFMGDGDSLPQQSTNSKSVQRLGRATEILLLPIGIRIELFEQIPQIEHTASVALCVLNCFLLQRSKFH